MKKPCHICATNRGKTIFFNGVDAAFGIAHWSLRSSDSLIFASTAAARAEARKQKITNYWLKDAAPVAQTPRGAM